MINELFNNGLVQISLIFLPQFLEDSVEDHIEKAGALLAEAEKGEGESREEENDESKVYFCS